MKILIVIGNRPHFIKCAPLIKELQKNPDVELTIIHSGQHYDPELSDVFLKDFKFPGIDVNLQVGSASCSIQTGSIMVGLDPVFRNYRPDVVVSMGDTNTTLAAALTAYQMHIPNAHIEAGMRENIWRPEEINKRIADHCADYLFAPIPRAVKNLKDEGVDESRIYMTGDITLDTFVQNRAIARECFSSIRNQYPDIPEKFDLLTLHRAETVDQREILLQILNSLNDWPRPILFPMHPRTARRISEFQLDQLINGSRVIIRLPPLPYLPFLTLLIHATTIATDSSGVLKEAFYAQKPCLVLDDSTEYHEIFECRAAVMAGRTVKTIEEARNKLDRSGFPKAPPAIFGDGTAAVQMVQVLLTQPPYYQ